MLIRPFPYPFASALTVVSDVDGSSRARYDGYIGDIVRKYGLDFGDSMWLRASCESPASDVPIANGLGFFSRYYSLGNNEVERTFVRVRTLFESLAEYHAGNVDHFHAYLSKGPRVAVLQGGEPAVDGIAFSLTEYESQGFWRCADAYIDAMCVVLRGAPETAIESVTVTERDGRVTVYDRRVTAPKSGGEDAQAMFLAPGSVEDNFPLPRLDDIV